MPEQTQTQNQATEQQTPDFGKGRYSLIQLAVYNGAKDIFKMSSKAAEKLARSVATELGAIFNPKDEENKAVFANVKLGKSIKNNAITLSEAVKVKNVPVTNNIRVMRALDYINNAGTHGILWGKTQWMVVQDLRDYFASIEEKVKKQEQEEQEQP